MVKCESVEEIGHMVCESADSGFPYFLLGVMVEITYSPSVCRDVYVGEMY